MSYVKIAVLILALILIISSVSAIEKPHGYKCIKMPNGFFDDIKGYQMQTCIQKNSTVSFDISTLKSMQTHVPKF